MSAKETKEKILELTKQYYQEQFAQKEEYVEGQRVNYAGRVFDEKELQNCCLGFNWNSIWFSNLNGLC